MDIYYFENKQNNSIVFILLGKTKKYIIYNLKLKEVQDLSGYSRKHIEKALKNLKTLKKDELKGACKSNLIYNLISPKVAHNKIKKAELTPLCSAVQTRMPFQAKLGI